ncbi:MAG: VWA domain-containing protein, partial [Gammaproteobacteria bacterium]|nr:VWA domain-containing protein [Gammaproteobacteria bacterium]
MIIKSDSLARTSHFFCRVCIAFVFLAFPPTVSLAADSCKADVVFLMDNTGSMGGMINSTRTNAVNILNKIGGGDPRFAGIDVQFGVATFWGDPLEHDTSLSGGHAFRWYCGPTPSYPSRGSVGPVPAWSWHARYRCDKNPPADPSDDFVSLCHTAWHPPGSACTRTMAPRLSQMTASQLTTHYADLRKFARRAYRVDQQLTSDKSAARRSMDAWKADGGGDIPEANYFALHQLATEGGQTDLYPSCRDNWAAGSYAVGDCIKDGDDHYTANIAHRSDVAWAPTRAHSSGSYVVSTKASVQTIFVAAKDVPVGTSSPELNPTYWQALGDIQP